MDEGLGTRLQTLRNEWAEEVELLESVRKIPLPIPEITQKYIALQSQDVQRECRKIIAARNGF